MWGSNSVQGRPSLATFKAMNLAKESSHQEARRSNSRYSFVSEKPAKALRSNGTLNFSTSSKFTHASGKRGGEETSFADKYPCSTSNSGAIIMGLPPCEHRH